MTHNGSINNDNIICERLRNGNKETLPVVDSVAINVILSQIDGDPKDHFTELGHFLSEMQGPQAVHAVWEDYPGLSLFYRGSASGGSPLIMATHRNKGGCIVYGSEPESVWSIIRAMGPETKVMEPNHDSWAWRQLDTNALMLVENGEPIMWGSIPFTSQAHIIPKNSADWVTRYLPSEDGDKKKVVVREDSLDHWSVKRSRLGDQSIMFADHEDRKDDLIYQRTEKKDKPLNLSDAKSNTYLAGFSEADHVYDSHDGLIHAFMGEMEIVIDKFSGKLLDVFNYAWKGAEYPRFKMISKETVEQDFSKLPDLNFVNETWESFYMKHKKTTKLSRHLIPTKEVDYEYDTVDYQMYQNYAVSDYILGSENKIDKKVDGRFRSRVSLDTMRQDLIFHENGKFAWKQNKLCIKHKTLYNGHDDPGDCPDARWASLQTMANLETIVAYPLINDQFVLEYDNTSAWCELGMCEWSVASETIYYYLKETLELVTGEICMHCYSSVEIKSMPLYMSTLAHGKMDMIYTP